MQVVKQSSNETMKKNLILREIWKNVIFGAFFMDDVSMTSLVRSRYSRMTWRCVTGLTWMSDATAMSD